MKTMTLRKVTTIIMVIAIVMTMVTVNNVSVKAATSSGIIKDTNIADKEDSFTTTLSSGETATISIKNKILSIKVDSTDYTFKIGDTNATVREAIINTDDNLLHILTLERVYYVFDLNTGKQVIAYGNINNGIYCNSKNLNSYMIYGNILLNQIYFYELTNDTSTLKRKLLMNREEFDTIMSGGDPSIVVSTSTPEPTATVTPKVTPEPNATVTPTGTPEPNATVTPTGTPEPTATVTPTGTPEPTATVTTTGTPEPTATVAPIVTTEPQPTVAPATPVPAKASYKIISNKSKMQLQVTENGDKKLYTISYNKKKATAKFNGKTYKKVKSVGFTQKTHNVVLLMKNGYVKVLPTAAKGKIRTYKGKYKAFKYDSSNFVTKATQKGKSLSLSKAKPLTK